MGKRDLCKFKIDIQTSNLFRYREIAILIDKPKFLEEVQKIRKEFDIETLLPFKSGKRYKVLKKLSEKLLIPIDSSNWFTASMEWAKKFPQKDKLLMARAKRICREYKQPTYMINDIYQAVLFGKVIEESVSIGVVHQKTKVERPYVAIFPTLYTTYEDVKKALDQAKNILKGNSLFSSSFNFRSNKLKKISPHRVKRHREWYWRNLAGESYTDIALSLKSKKFQDDYKRRKADRIEGTGRYLIGKELPKVAQAIERYCDALAE